MHTGVISFCDRIAYNIKSSETKDAILTEIEKLFNVRVMQRHWSKLDFSHIANYLHYAALRSNGNPYFLYFTTFEGVPIFYFIDKKVHPGYELPRIIIGRGRWNFPGETLLEGEMVKTGVDGRWLFLINDIIGYNGARLDNMVLPKRIELINDILEHRYTREPMFDFCVFQVKKYAFATQEGIDGLLELAKTLPYTLRGLYFWPFNLKHKPKLINFNDELIRTVQRAVKDNAEFKTVIPSAKPSPASAPTVKEISAPGATKILYLRKTENPDVYDIFETASSDVYVNIALVSTLQTSKMLRMIFRDLTVAVFMPFECVYNSDFSKWLPIRAIH